MSCCTSNETKVRFVSCTLETFNNLSKKDGNTLYFISDTKEIYKGCDKYGGSADLSDVDLLNVKVEDENLTFFNN